MHFIKRVPIEDNDFMNNCFDMKSIKSNELMIIIAFEMVSLTKAPRKLL